MSPRDQVLPSIEIPRQSEKRRTESHLEHMAERMTLRSVTPSHAHGEAFGRSHGSVPNSPDDPTYKRRRTACYAGSHRDLRFDPRNGRPIPVTENLSPRLPYHRVELGPEIRLQDGHNLRQQYPSPQEQPLLLGHLREMPSGPFYAQPASLDPRPETDRARFDPTGAVSMHIPPTSSGPTGMMIPDDRAVRATVESSRPEAWSQFPIDRSPRLDRVRSLNVEDRRPSNWETRTNGNRHVLHELPSGKIYADGFVRQVDVREVRPVESPNNPRAQPGMIVQASRHRVPDQYAQEGSHNHNQSSSESPLPVPWATSLSYPLPPHPPARQAYSYGTGSRDHRHGNASHATRRAPDPRFFQMAEQNRPVYVQRVNSQPPQNPVPDGRHVVIVD
ncbi:hypothetical protein N7468_000130 [Penicillium chermesinum]|uniref:Uncharacterized protein n=1 Tax=Penicillium chermesinum TaxID=63820 RepID=A0A9W9PMQ0_9EURO|nr:uncharacterized protein N7468_000130 [Penicillium chermesinum]KAJ5248679.1 hypothetical protein N7468_000130 [Penicillium chermesinum]